MKLWGLTGGIASGKSTVHKMFVQHGAQVLDADAIYHDLLLPAAGHPSVLARYIETAFHGVLAADGTIDRRALGERVFNDAHARRRLEQLTHPAIAAAVARQLAQLEQQGHAHALYDVPLLYERHMAARFAGVIVVWVPLAIQLARLMARDNLDRAAAQARLQAQLPLQHKRQLACWVVDNGGTLAATKSQVEQLWQAIQVAA